MFKTNIGSMNRVLRIIVGPQTPLGWIGLVPLFTVLESTRPVYSLFGWSGRGK